MVAPARIVRRPLTASLEQARRRLPPAPLSTVVVRPERPGIRSQSTQTCPWPDRWNLRVPWASLWGAESADRDSLHGERVCARMPIVNRELYQVAAGRKLPTYRELYKGAASFRELRLRVDIEGPLINAIASLT